MTSTPRAKTCGGAAGSIRFARESDARDAYALFSRVPSPHVRFTEHVWCARLRSAAPEPEVDVFRAFERAYDGQGDERLHEIASDWFGSIVAYVETMAARQCVQPGKDCGWCDSCEARLDVAALRQRAQEASQ